MIWILLAFACALVVAARPVLLAYFLLFYMVWDGLASRTAAAALKLSIGSVNVFPEDMMFAAMLLLLPVGLVANGLAGRRSPAYSPSTRRANAFVVLFLSYQLMRFALGYFDHVPLESLIRMFSSDFQAIYFFLPLMFVREEKQLKSLLVLLVAVALLFPIGQLLFASRKDAEMLLREQGTYRLGYGDSAIPVGYGFLALYVWERKWWLFGLPVAGLVMLAHRSAYVAIVVALLLAAVLKGKKIKSVGVMAAGASGALLVLLLAQHFSGQEVLHYGLSRVDQTFAATGTTEARLRVIPYLFHLWMEHPLFGMSYHDIYAFRESLPPGVTNSAGVFHPHNFVLRALVQWGLVGTSILFAIIGNGLMAARRVVRDARFKRVGVFLFAAQVYFIVFALMNTTLTSAGFFYWILLGATFWYVDHLAVAPEQAVKAAEPPVVKQALPILARKRRATNGLR